MCADAVITVENTEHHRRVGAGLAAVERVEVLDALMCRALDDPVPNVDLHDAPARHWAERRLSETVGMASSALPGTYRVVDEVRVEFADALAAWVPIARDELVATARTYQAVTTYLELSERVQELSGIRTRMLLANWIGKLLERVAQDAKDAGEPPLTSLCVHQDGTIGPGYAQAPKSVEEASGDDIEYDAARHRLLCYQKYAGDLPADGGQPALTRAESDRRARGATERRAQSRPSCPTCFTELPATGRCDYC